MDDGLTLQRCQHEESRAARIIRNTTLLFNRFVRYVNYTVFVVMRLERGSKRQRSAAEFRGGHT